MAPPLKHPADRRNKTKPHRGEWIEIDVPELDTPVLRDLTTLEKGHFNVKCRQRWRVWQREPVTTYWTKADVEAALDLLELYNVDDWTRFAAEIRQREDRLALNPKGKRDLRFRIVFGVGKEATKDHKPQEREVPENVVDIDSRRGGLTA